MFPDTGPQQSKTQTSPTVTEAKGDSEASTTDTKEESAHKPLDWKSRKTHSRIDECIASGGTPPTIDMSNLMGRTFITDPQDDGEQTRATVVGIE